MFYDERYKMFLKANISYNNHGVLRMFLHVTLPSARSVFRWSSRVLNVKQIWRVVRIQDLAPFVSGVVPLSPETGILSTERIPPWRKIQLQVKRGGNASTRTVQRLYVFLHPT